MRETLSDAERAQLRRRLRTWVGLAGPAPALRRSTLRAQVLRLAAEVAAGRGGGRVPITAGLRHALACAWRDPSDPYAEALAAARKLVLRAGDTAADIAAWDAVLTTAELRPSAAPTDPIGAHRATLAAQSDPSRRAAISEALTGSATDPGPYLRRRGAATLADARALFWDLVEPALFDLLPLPEATAAARRAFDNLTRWDSIVADVARRHEGDEGQALAARFLEPQVMRAYLTLPAGEIARVAGRAGKNLRIATLTDRHVPTEDEALAVRATERATPESLAAEAERWTQLFESVGRGVEAGVFEPRKVVFLWLSAAVGAGEAWRLAGLPLAQIGSANYHRNQLLNRLAERLGHDAARLPNPEKPDVRARGLIALLNMRAGTDPFIDARAGVTPGPALDDAALLGLMMVFNLPRAHAARLLPAVGCADGPAALVARSLRAVRADRARRAALDGVLDDLGPASEGGARIADRDLLFLLCAMVIGLPSEAASRLAAADGDRSARAALERWLREALDDPQVPRWLDGEPREPRPAPRVNRVLAALSGCPQVPTPPPKLKRRPVEREAQLRLRLGDRD